MPISLRNTVAGGTLIGQTIDMPEFFAEDFTQNGMRFLRSGSVETDTAKFDEQYWGFTRNTAFTESIKGFINGNVGNHPNKILQFGSTVIWSAAPSSYRSTDGGATFTPLSGIGDGRLAYDGNTVAWVGGGLVADTLRISTDSGATWTNRTIPNMDLGANLICPNNIGGWVIVGRKNLEEGTYIYTSNNDGTSVAIRSQVPVNSSVYEIFKAPNGNILAAGRNNNTGSTYDMVIWTIANNGEGSFTQRFTALASNLTSITARSFYLLGSEIYLFTSEGLIYKSSDNGITWNVVKSVTKWNDDIPTGAGTFQGLIKVGSYYLLSLSNYVVETEDFVTFRTVFNGYSSIPAEVYYVGCAFSNGTTIDFTKAIAGQGRDKGLNLITSPFAGILIKQKTGNVIKYARIS